MEKMSKPEHIFSWSLPSTTVCLLLCSLLTDWSSLIWSFRASLTSSLLLGLSSVPLKRLHASWLFHKNILDGGACCAFLATTCLSWVIVEVVAPSWVFRDAPMIIVDTGLMLSEEDYSDAPLFWPLLQSNFHALSRQHFSFPLVGCRHNRDSWTSGLCTWVWSCGSYSLYIFCCIKHCGFPLCIERFWIQHL